MCIFKRKKKLEIGQIWVSHEDNPFNTNIYCAEVLDLKCGWVQYCNFHKNSFNAEKEYHRSSCKESEFRWLYEDFVANNREFLFKI